MKFKKELSLFLLGSFISLTGCLTPNKIDLKSLNKNTSTSLAAASGAKAAKVIFLASNPAGSFNAPTGSTSNIAGQGHKIVRIFNADGTLLSDGGYTNSTWPKWLVSVELTISGASNSAATDSDCARFAAAGTDGAAVCDFALDGTADTPCGAPTGYYRISERNCATGTIADGTGGPSDGVTIRTVFSRNPTYLAAHENIMAVLEYSASAINPPPQDPTSCFSNGKLDPTNTGCADMTWQAFLKHNLSEIQQPFLTFIPPMFSYVKTADNRSGSGVITKKIILPLASDTGLSVLQFSRKKALPLSAPNFTSICSSNSALCLGVVFNSITFYRI